MTFWAELRRRNVLRVAGAYLVVAWLAVQVVAAAMGALNLPEWFDGAVFVLLAAGFPIALIIAWAFESRDGQIVLTAADGPPPQFRSIDAVLIVAIVALIGVSLFQVTRPGAPAPVSAGVAPPPQSVAPAPAAANADGRRSIAVLPFADLSPERDQEYFADGLSEELLNAFAQIDGLRVIARTSSFAFKGRNADVREIGATLGVAHILEGSVRKAGDRLRITAQLIDARDGSHLWSENYDRQLTDVFVIQDDIAMAVADALSVTLGLGARLADFGGTGSFEAYDHYLRGRDLIARFDANSALREFGRATQIDPDYALAWTGIARAALQLSVAGDRSGERQAVALDAVQRAMRIEPELWQAYSLHGLALNQQLDWMAAQRAFDAAARLGATETDDEWASTYASFLSDTGRMTEALAVLEAARAANPLSLQISNAAAWALHNLGRSQQAAAERARGRGLEGNHAIWAYAHLTQLLADGDRDAIAAHIAGFPVETFGVGGVIDRWIAVWDRPERADAVLRAALADRDFMATMQGNPQLGALAALAAYHGDEGLAQDMLRAWTGANGVSPVHLWHPLLAGVRGAAEFKQIVRDFGLPELWRATGDWGDYCRPAGADDFVCS